MKRTTINLLVAVVTVFGATAAFGQTTATDSAAATATIIPGITLTNRAGLLFGDMLSPTAAGTVTIDAAGTRTASGVVLAGGTIGAAAFDVTGGGNKGYTVTLPSAAVTLTSGVNTMTVGTFTRNCSSCTLDGAGAGSFTVGGTLNVGAGQAVGTYSGNFDVTVAYP